MNAATAFWRDFARGLSVLGWLAGLSGLGTVAAVAADTPSDPGAAASSPAPGVSVDLEYVEMPFSFYQWPVNLRARTEAFAKEPETDKGRLLRGVLEYPGAPTNGLAFLWNQGSSQLWLDLNANFDLTDDPAGAYTSLVRGGTYQPFAKVHLPRPAMPGQPEVLVELSLYGYADRFFANASLESLWQGKLALAGRDWQVGIIESHQGRFGRPSGDHLLVRPWEARARTFQVGIESAEALPYATNLFIAGRAFSLERTETVEAGKARMRLRFLSQEPKLGEVKLTGSFVRQLAFSGGPYLVVLDRPAPAFKIPIGHYDQKRVELQEGGTIARLQSRYVARDNGIAVAEDRSTELVAGGPLTNSVTINRRGKLLVFNYELRGADHGVYQLDDQDRSKPPQFAVYQAGKRIAEGKFEFG